MIEKLFTYFVLGSALLTGLKIFVYWALLKLSSKKKKKKEKSKITLQKIFRGVLGVILIPVFVVAYYCTDIFFVKLLTLILLFVYGRSNIRVKNKKKAEKIKIIGSKVKVKGKAVEHLRLVK